MEKEGAATLNRVVREIPMRRWLSNDPKEGRGKSHSHLEGGFSGGEKSAKGLRQKSSDVGE